MINCNFFNKLKKKKNKYKGHFFILLECKIYKFTCWNEKRLEVFDVFNEQNLIFFILINLISKKFKIRRLNENLCKTPQSREA